MEGREGREEGGGGGRARRREGGEWGYRVRERIVAGGREGGRAEGTGEENIKKQNKTENRTRPTHFQPIKRQQLQLTTKNKHTTKPHL